MKNLSRENILHRSFEISVLLKGIDGVLEIIGGFLLIFMSQGTLSKILFFLTQHELSEDPKDLIANYLIQLVQNLSIDTKLFAAFYLFSHGIIKIFLVIELLRNRLWAYPVSIVFLVIFILYQLYRLSNNYSSGLILLTLFDIFVIFLIGHEYKHVERFRKIQ
jgi:uncharacterized membrane protein